MTSSAQATESSARRILADSFRVMMITESFTLVRTCRKLLSNLSLGR